MKKLLALALALSLSLLTVGCGGAASSAAPSASSLPENGESSPVASISQEAAPAVSGELIVSAAASLTDCLTEMTTLFNAKYPDVKVTYNFGASGTLQQQIEQGAPADVFFSAGAKQMTALTDAGLMDTATVRDIVENKVVLVTPKDGTPLESFEKLAELDGKIAVGEPGSVPVGQYTQEVFKTLGLTDKVAAKLVYAKDVREVLSWVETGNAAAGIVYETDAKISDKVTICATAPADSHKPVVYPVGVIKDSKAPDAAKSYVDFLFTDEAKAVFTSYGFSPVF